MTFAEEIRLGIPEFLPEPMPYDNNINLYVSLSSKL